MERITNHAPFSANENKIGCTAFGTYVCCSRLGHCEGCPVNENAWEKLAAYEDTGIPPEIVGLLADQRFRLQKLRLQRSLKNAWLIMEIISG